MYSNPRTKLYNVLMGNTDTNNAIGRTAGAASSGDGGNFFTKKASSIGNAVGTTISAPISLAHDIGENIATQKFLGDSKARMKSIANKYGYDSWADWQDAYAEVKNSGDENRIAEMDEQLKEFQAQANANAEEATAKAKGYEDYRQNNLISKNINQDRGKFAGSAINTLSTATDLLGLTNGPVSNAVQGSIEGVADELEQNGLENFSWDRAKQNAIAGAATGAVVGGLNKGLSNSLAKKGGNLFKGSNKLTAGINSLGANHPLAATIATGAGRGALSGAAGGATGAGISAAMNGGDVLGSALQGAAQGAQQGAMAGSIMAGANMAINKTPGVGDLMQKVNQAQTDWENSGENFKERWQNTRAQDTWGNRFLDNGVERLNDRVGLGIKDVADDAKTARDYTTTRTPGPDQSIQKAAKDIYDQISNKYGDAVAESSFRDLRYLADDYSDYDTATGASILTDVYDRMANRSGGEDVRRWIEQSGVFPSSSRTTTNDIGELGANGAQPQNQETEVYRTLTGDNKNTTSSDLMYGESELGNRTRRGMVADSLERLGNTLEGAQTNVTRAAAKDLGIESTGKVVENVRKKTGITNLETQARLAKELTGSDNSLMDNIQRQALNASENGQSYKVDTTPVLDEVDSIVDKYADTNMFGSQNARNKFISNLKRDISNFDSDVLSIANRMKANAADLRGKGVASPTPADSAKAKIYTEVANKLDDLSYKAIPQENVDTMFDATISEMRGRANQAKQNGNNDIAKAYNKLADSLDAEPRTIKAYRSFKKDFVDTSKISELTNRAENGAAAQMGRSFGGGAKRFLGTVAQRPVNAALAKAGGVINNIADKVAGDSTPTTSGTTTQTATSTGYNPATQVYNAIGRREGLTNAEEARTANYLSNAVQSANKLEDLLAAPGNTGSTSVYNSVYGNPSTTAGDYWMGILGNAMQMAMDAGDATAFVQLYSMYQDELSKQEKSNTSQTKLTDKQRQANAAARALADFEQTEPNFAYDVSDIPLIGGIANLGGNEYASKAEALALQIGYMLSGATVNKEEAKNIGIAYVPQPRDNESVRRSKLNQLRGIISDYQQTYGE